MDYDDNDFQGQNLNLAGEGSLKISPVLRPYALPKFDFDDSLQGHLRFDSLVENEVFLGIPSQEDNQWIEDFSRGSSGIEFDSSAAESCSISRHNNVWSEATSSESVEMLLKSVGQEERVVGETIIEESDVCDELGNLTNQMEPNFTQDDGKDHDMHSQNASPPDLYVNAEGLDPNLQSQEVELSSSELDPKFASEKFEEKNDTKSDDVNQGVIDNVVNESVDIEMPEDTSVSRSQFGNTDSSEDLKDQENQRQASEIDIGNANRLEGIWKIVEKQEVIRTKANMEGQMSSASTAENCTYNVESSLYVASKVESADNQLVEISISNVEVPTSSPLNEGCEPQIAEGWTVDVSSDEPSPASKGEVMVSSGGSEINQQPEGNMHPESTVVFLGDEGSGPRAVEVRNTKAEIVDHPELNMDSLTQITHVQSYSVVEKENAPGIDGEQDRGALVSSSDTSTVSVLGKGFEQGGVSSIDCVSDASILMTSYPSDDLLAGKTSTESLKAENNEEYNEESNAEGDILPPIISGSVQINQENPSSELDDVHMDQDVSVHKSGGAKLSTESSDMECEVVRALDCPKKSISISSGESSGNIVVAHGSDSHTTTETEPAMKEANSKSSEATDALHLPSGSDFTTNIVIDHDDQPKSPILGVSLQHLDDKEDMEVDLPREASPLNLTSQAASPVSEGLISEVKESTSADCAGTVQHEMDGRCSLMVDNFPASQSEQAAVAKEVGQGCYEKMEASPIPCDSSIKGGDEAEAVGPENPEETKMERYDRVQHLPVNLLNDHQASVDSTHPSKCDAGHVVQDGGNSAVLDKHGCDSPKVISCVKLSQNAKDNQEEGKGTMLENVSLSEVTDNVEGDIQSISRNLCENSKGERSFTFEVSPSAGVADAGKVWQSFPTIQASNLSTKISEGSPKSGADRVDPKVAQEITQSSPQTPVGGIAKVGAKGTTERKSRRKSVGKESSKKGIDVKETTIARQSERSEKSCMSLATTGTGQVLQVEELKSCESVEHEAAKPCGVISIPASNLPDLNTSVSLFQQPFTDMQQVQLRAQILVYGSLIQGTTPEEACMIAAFGPSDGGRSPWEPAWRTSIERLHGQKSQANNSDTPVQPRSGIMAPDQGMKHGSVKSKVPSSSTGRANKKGTPSPVINPMIPLSSPLWNISTPSGDGLQAGSIPRGAPLDYHQALSPLHPYQTPPVQNFVGHNPSWLSQGPFPGQWVAAPPTSPFNISGRMSTLPITEAVKLTPVKESGAPVIKHTPPIPVVYAGGTSAFAGPSPLPDLKKVTASSGLPFGDSKSRKRKKVPVAEPVGQISFPVQTQTMPVSAPVVIGHLSKNVEVHGQISLLAQNRTESVSAPVVSSIFSTAVAVSTTASFNSKSTPVKFPTAVTPTPSNDHPKSADQNAEEKVIISEETFSKVEEAKLQAEEAAKHAAAAVSHCQGVWSRLEQEKNSGLVSDVEAKLASAAVSIAAAASVAKAAAAAAKIASNAAEQAKLMADEVLASSGSGNFSQSRIISLPNAVNNFGKATPASILKGEDGSSRSSSIIVAAREAARRRVEAASAASKHAENLDAIVKAAELAAEAVSQAGKIVAMGDPLPLSELVASGPEGYWKTPQLAPEQQGVISDNVNSHKLNTKNIEADSNVSARPGPSDMEVETLKHGMSPGEVSGDLIEDPKRVVDGISGSNTSHEKDLGGLRTRRASDLSKTIGVVPELEIGSSNTSVIGQNEYHNTSGISQESIIKEGCLVEVFKDGGKFKAAWFAANVLNLKDGKAYLCYTELQSDEGKLKEWVALEGDGTKVPRIRIAHPMTTMKFEGTRKRRRGAVIDYSWSVGDRVDAWLQNCWCEGLVTEKDKNDETSLTVHFPAQGETSVVRAWHLRPTLIWKDEKWIEWSSSKGDRSTQSDAPKEKRPKLGNHSEEGRGKEKLPLGDTPQEKRPKLGIPTVEGQGKDRIQTSVDNVASGRYEEAKLHNVASGRREEAKLLPLSADEKVFNVGKNTRVENKLDSHRTVRSGLQKEGPRVIFGVPKPGKKQKFMDVSKHYFGDRNNKNDSGNDPVKFARYLMPQGTGSRGWRNNSKNDNKEKQTAEIKPRVFKSGKAAQNPSGRTLAPNDNLLTSAKFSPRDATMTDNVVKSSVSNDENESGEQNLMEFRLSSISEDTSEGPLLASSHAPQADAPKRVPSSNARSERLNKGKLAPAGGKSAKQEVKDKSVPEVAEPRRSNRRIQPTSRLLEGLQSSLTITKIPAVSHDRSHRGQNRATQKGK